MRHSILTMALSLAFLPAVGLAADEHKHHHHHAEEKTGKTPELKGESLYNSSTDWRDASGKATALNSFRGQKIILTMAYTNCTYTCPLTVAKLKKIESELAAKGVSDYKIVMASFDTARDTPAQLAAYMKKQNLPAARWVWLSPKADKDVRELAALLGIVYSKDKQGEFSHSNIIVLLDQEGVVRERLEGLSTDHKGFVARLAGKPDDQ